MARSGTGREIVVGIDPLDPSVPTLAWAADEGDRRNLSLRLVLAVPPPHDTRHMGSAPRLTSLRARGREALESAGETVFRLSPGLRVVTELVDGRPAAVLCRRSAVHARMVVVGSRRLSTPAEILGTRSVAAPLSAHADCPVVVVRAPESTADLSARLVVGVDGSESSRQALRFAFEEAGLRRAPVHAVQVWQRPALTPAGEESGREECARLLAATVAEWSADRPDVRCTREIRRGHPVEELARASAGALGVVVGRRGRGGYTGMRLGSVTHGLLHRAECPVVTVPGGS
ncbi:universal stress protein [Streptomyces sp. JH34]|uniref:universal stress protein n=1 Tax=Streptomyces sp. JH34 TaxID=2793633 RepID=UPI0023F83661|nr:universal stress protein [Streptomyces sp. JH34]MDF6022466.1 universal stress protein [Streptomyces sp. JH34]